MFGCKCLPHKKLMGQSAKNLQKLEEKVIAGLHLYGNKEGLDEELLQVDIDLYIDTKDSLKRASEAGDK